MRQCKRRMQGLKSPGYGLRFLAAYGPIAPHFRLRHHFLPALKTVKRRGQDLAPGGSLRASLPPQNSDDQESCTLILVDHVDRPQVKAMVWAATVPGPSGWHSAAGEAKSTKLLEFVMLWRLYLYETLLEGLAQDLQDVVFELRQFIQKEHAMVRQRTFHPASAPAPSRSARHPR